MRTKLIREALDTLNNLNEDTRLKRRPLDEDLKGYFKNNYMKVFGEIPEEPAEAKKKAEKDAYAKALAVACIDPTFKGREIRRPEDAMNKDKGSYFDWLMRMIKKGVISYEDMMAHKDEFTDQLVHFDAAKKRNKLPSDKKDIMQFKSLSDLTELMNSIGADVDTSKANASTFQGVIKNIRAALQAICGFKDNEIPADIQNTSDCLTLVCENGKWECWQINSIWGAMLADTYGFDWGGGATWCTGGQYGVVGSRPRQGEEVLNSAKRFYPTYTGNGNILYFFQQKDNSVTRPQNKAQFQVKDGYKVDNFFHANDNSIGLNDNGTISYTGGSWRHSTADVMSVFIQQEGLLEPMKNSILKGIEPILDAENRARLEAGEPYIYTGGKIKDSFKNSIKKIIFEYEGKKYEVNISENPNFLNASSVNEMYNMIQLAAGEPYLYDGTDIPSVLKPMIQTIIVAGPGTYQNRENLADMYKRNGVSTEDDNSLIIPANAFRGCENLTTVTLPVEATLFAHNAFTGMPEDVKVVLPRYPDRGIYFNHRDLDWMKDHFVDENGRPAFGKVSQEEPQQ